MTQTEFLQALYEKSFQAGMNQQYYQTLLDHWSWYDSAVRLSVLLFAFGCLLLTIYEEKLRSIRETYLEWLSSPRRPGQGEPNKTVSSIISIWRWVVEHGEWALRSLTWSILSVTVALILVFYPTEEKVRQNSDLYRDWTNIRATVDSLSLLAKNEPKGDTISTCMVQRLTGVIADIASATAKEPTPNQKLVEKCYGDESERRYGKGIRSYQDRLRAHTARTAGSDQQNQLR